MKRLSFNSDNLMVINFETNLPSFKEDRNKEWIKFGDNNNYPNYLIDIFNKSAKHNAIVTGKVHYVSGGGIAIDGDNSASQLLESFIEQYQLEDLVPKISTDIELFNGVYLEFVPSRSGGVAQVNHVGFEKIRISKKRDYFLYSNDWSSYRQSEETTGLRRIEIYNPSTKSGIMYFKSYRPGDNTYPLPEYIGCIPYIEVDYEIANFHVSNTKNGFSAGTLLSFNNGVPLKEEQQKVEQKVKEKFTGSSNAGQLMITFSQSKDTAPTVMSLMPNDFDKSFLQLNETVTQEIFTGHKITSLSLFGIKESKGLGSKDELQQAFSLFQNGYLNTRQKRIEKILNKIIQECGFLFKVKLIKTSPIESTVPEEKLYSVMTNDEIREKAGLKPLSIEAAPVQKMSSCFSSTKDISFFASKGVSRKDYKIYESSEVANGTDVLLREIGFYKQGFVQYDRIERSILDLIDKNGKITPEEIAKAIKQDIKDVKKAYNDLIEKKLLSINNDQKTLSPEAKTIIEKEPAPTEKVEILYSYEERAGLPPLLTKSRDFCQELIDLDKLYSREEIELISKEVGRDVWATRGGYFHNTKLNQTTPYCRHIWKQNVVRRK